MGGQWLGPTQDRMYELVEELGLKTVPLYNEGKLVLQLLGKRGLMGSTKGAIPRLGPFDCLVRYFGEEAARPLEYLERDWMAEEFSRGCYGAHFTTGAWTAYGPALTEPVGPIHWAGAECSPVWNGCMEGAVRSGEATAKAVLGELSGLALRPVIWPTGSSVIRNQGSTQRRRGSILATWK